MSSTGPGPRVLLVLAIAVTGFSMRTAVTSVGAVLHPLQDGLNASGAAAGLITTLPVLCFAAVGSFGPKLGRRFGANRVLVVSLACAAVGQLSRAAADTVWLFAVLSILALAGGAISNVSMPTLVKAYFPSRIGLLTALYTTTMAVGATAGAGLSVPAGNWLGDGADAWRYGIGAWALFSAIAVIPWLPVLGHRDRTSGHRRISAARLLRSPTSWALALFFGFQSMQAYIAFGWFARFFEDHGLSDGAAGGLVAYYSALSIPISMVMPWLTVRGPARIIAVLCSCYLLGYVGLAWAPTGAAYLWLFLIGLGSGQFPVALTMIGLRTRHVQVTATVSAFVQGLGYIIAGAGPLLVGALLGHSDNWTGPFVVLFVAVVIGGTAGLLAARDTSVDHEIGFHPGLAESQTADRVLPPAPGRA